MSQQAPNQPIEESAVLDFGENFQQKHRLFLRALVIETPVPSIPPAQASQYLRMVDECVKALDAGTEVTRPPLKQVEGGKKA